MVLVTRSKVSLFAQQFDEPKRIARDTGPGQPGLGSVSSIQSRCESIGEAGDQPFFVQKPFSGETD